MYFFKNDLLSPKGQHLLFQTKNELHLYNAQTDLVNSNIKLELDDNKRHVPLCEIDGYKSLTKLKSIFGNTVYLMKYKKIKKINLENFAPNTPKNRWPYTIEKHFAHDGTQKNAFFSYDKKFLIAQSDKMITIAPIGEQSKCTLTPKEFDKQDFKHIALSPNNKLAICTQANKIYFINLEQCEFIEQAPKKIPWWRRWSNAITSNPWKSFAIAQTTLITAAVASYALYKWKPQLFSKFKWSFS